MASQRIGVQPRPSSSPGERIASDRHPASGMPRAVEPATRPGLQAPRVAHNLAHIPVGRHQDTARDGTAAGRAPIQMVPWWKKTAKYGMMAGGTLAAGAGALSLAGVGLALSPVVAGGLLIGGGLSALGGYGVDSSEPSSSKVQLPEKPYTGDRPKKPKGLQQQDGKGKPLTAHHKYPYNRIKSDVNEAVSNDSSLIGSSKTGHNLAEWGDREEGAPVGIGGLTWTRHNLFMGPEDRDDDPGEKLDLHFTKSGTVTPRSELALDVAASGGIGKLDTAELTRRLQELNDRQSESKYDPSEWVEGENGKMRQKGKPKGWDDLSYQEMQKYVRERKEQKAKKSSKGKKKQKIN